MRLLRLVALVSLLAAMVGAATAGSGPVPEAAAAQTGGGVTFRATVSTTGQQTTLPATRARISADGRRVVYQTKAALLPGDTNGLQDIYWTDLSDPYHPVTKLVSGTSTGAMGAADAEFAEIAGDGRLVVFATLAGSIVPGVGGPGVYVRDMDQPDPSKAITLVAVPASRPVISDDGRIVSYNSLPAATSDIFVKDLQTGRTLRVTTAGDGGSDAESFRPEISGDGNHVVFASDLQLLPADTNADRDVYVADLRAWRAGGSTFALQLVSVALDGTAAGMSSSRPGINRDGSVVAFQSRAGNLVAGDTNGQGDAFVRDYRSNAAGVTYAVSYKVDGTLPTAAVGSRPQLDDSGDVVAFVSTGGNIVNGDTNNREDAFVRNWRQEVTTRQWNTATYLLGISPTGQPGSCPGIPNLDEGTKDISTRPYLSGDGKVAVFISGQCNLTPATAFGGADTNLVADVFLRTFRPVGPPPTAPYVALPAPARLLDTRPGGATADQQFAGIGARAAGSVLELAVAGRAGLPAAPGSVVLNTTVVGPAGPGYATVYPCGVAPPTASNLNFGAGQTIANAVVSKVSADGKVCLFTSATTHLLVDVGGAFPAVKDYAPLAAPARLVDTRPGAATVDGLGAGGGPRPAGDVLTVQVGGRAGVPATAPSVVLNVTAVGALGDGYVTVYPCGQAPPTASNLNVVAGDTVPNAVVARTGPGGTVCLFTSAATNLIVDVAGSFPTAAVYTPLTTPARLLDTRPGAPTVDGIAAGGGLQPAGVPLALPVLGRGGVGAATGSVVMNVTAVGPLGTGYVTVYPCGEPVPNASSLNVVAGRTVPNAVVAKVGAGGAVCLVASVPTHLLVDAAGTLP